MRRLFVTALVMAAWLGSASYLLAADDAEHAAKKGLLEWSTDLGLWSLVVFVLLLFILSKLAWKPMLEGLKKREENILGAIQEAEKTRQETAKLQAELQARLNKAGEEVLEILEEGRRDAQALKDEMVTTARQEVSAERDRLRREIDTAKDQALKQIWTEAAQLATLISAKAIRRQLTPEDHRRFVDEALAELREAGEDRLEETRSIRA